jgi:hypothetical protein
VADGVEFRAPNLVVLNSDTEVGKVILIELERDVEDAQTLVGCARALRDHLCDPHEAHA